MKLGFGAVVAIGILAALPGLALAQPHPDTSHQSAARPASHSPAMHSSAQRAPTTHYRATSSARRPVTHNTVHRSTITHRRVVHHVRTVNRTHRVVRHSARIRALRRDVFARHRFHAGFYRAPPGYRYRRWTYGGFLPGVYWGRNYWITDFLAFGLLAPPTGYVWVRYGPDAILIDEYTGEIIRVDYGLFF